MSTNDFKLAVKYGTEVSHYLSKAREHFRGNPRCQSIVLQLEHTEEDFIAFFEKEARSEFYNFWLEPLPFVREWKQVKVFRNRPPYITSAQVACSELMYERLVSSLGN